MSEPVELPSAPVLAYLTQTRTAARARHVTAIAVLILGLVSAGLALWLLVDSGVQVYRETQRVAAARGTTMTLMDIRFAIDMLRWRWQHDWRMGLGMLEFLGSPESRACCVLYLGIPAVMLLSLFFLVGRGSARACRWCLGMVAPLMLLAGALTALVTALALVLGLRVFAGRAEPGMLKWVAVFPPGLLIVMLMKDVCAYLLWFARHPFIEKPAVDFVTGRPKG